MVWLKRELEFKLEFLMKDEYQGVQFRKFG